MTKNRTMLQTGTKTHSRRELHGGWRFARLAYAALALLTAALVSACAATEVVIGEDCADGFCVDAGPPPPSFTEPPPDGGDGGPPALEPPPALLACIGTECQFPYADCSQRPSFRCETNLMNDPANCGACGVSCEGFGGINMSASCVQGKCEFECMLKSDSMGGPMDFRDCNGLLDDGCEVNISADPDNCGACGNVCADGQRCIKGKCGCPPGMLDCGHCVDPRFNDYSCGACGNACDWMPEGACDPMPDNTQYGCVMSECNKLKCRGGFRDCNGDLHLGCASDGCETDISTDPNNCGGCGVVCGPDQECRDDGYGPQCLDTCEKARLTACVDGCRDLLSDAFNCGACMTSCPNPRANQVSSCTKGVCEMECLPGFADCNGDPSDGCEVDLTRHPAHCGACGDACDFAIGQPCIEGKCLMVECDDGPTEAK